MYILRDPIFSIGFIYDYRPPTLQSTYLNLLFALTRIPFRPHCPAPISFIAVAPGSSLRFTPALRPPKTAPFLIRTVGLRDDD